MQQKCQKCPICRHQMCSFKLQMHQNSFSVGTPPPNSAGGAYDASPNTLVDWGGGHPSHSLLPRRLWRLDLGAISASVVRPPTQIPGYAYACQHDRTASHRRPDWMHSSRRTNEYKFGFYNDDVFSENKKLSYAEKQRVSYAFRQEL